MYCIAAGREPGSGIRDPLIKTAQYISSRVMATESESGDDPTHASAVLM